MLDCQTAFQEAARSCVDQLRVHRKLAIAADPDAIHSMRIALTRLRAVVLFFPLTDDDAWCGIEKDLKWLNRALGKARDDDVIADYIHRKKYRRWASSSRHSLMHRQDTSHRKLNQELRSARYDHLIKTINAWIGNGPWLLSDQSARSQRIDVYARARLRVWRTRVSRQGRHLRSLHPKKLHRLRIWCKRYRYIVAALQTLGVAIARRELAFSETAKRVHGVLGDLRDLRRLRRAAHDRPPSYRRSKYKLMQRARKSLQPSE